jgi:alpha-L-fucosidase
MVFELQPDIIVNNRNQLPGDFSTPEQRIQAETGGRAWESCMTMNDSWGYQSTDDDWKSPKTVIRNLITCSRDGGNYLLNIGPRGDGSIPDESVQILQTVGKWIGGNGKSIYQTDVCKVRRSAFANFTRKGNTLYIHAYFWPGSELNIAGLRTKVKSASLLRQGMPVKFAQTEFQTKFTGLPTSAPDSPVTTLVVECESEPVQDTDFVRKNRERLKA